MNGTVVGVLRGGPSNEHEVSLRSGHAVIANLPKDRYTVRDLYVDKQGQWHERGKIIDSSKALQMVDVVLSTLHGEYGENGGVQRLLERFGIPYIGSDPMSSYLAMHKVFSKEHAIVAGIKTPKYRFINPTADVEEIAYEIVRSFAQPVIIKPLKGGSSLGVHIVGGYAQVHSTLLQLLAESSAEVLVEELIRGTEATVGVVEDLRGEKLYALPPVEIVPPANEFFSYESKYNGQSQEICPGRFTREVSDELMLAAKTMHQQLGQRHYSRSDFIVSKNGIYFLELNSAVACGLTTESLLPKSLAAVGISFPDFLTHLINTTLH